MDENVKLQVESVLYKHISLILESEYTVDRLNNVVYKEGGRLRAMNEIKRLLNEFSEKYNIPPKEIREYLMECYATMQNTNKMEYNELFYIFDDIGTEEKVNEDIKEGNIEKYEKDI